MSRHLSLPRAHAIGAVVAIALALVGVPDTAQGQVFITGSIGSTFGSDLANCESVSNCETRRTTYGGSIGYLDSLFGWEGEVVHSPKFFGESSISDANGVTTLMLNLLLAPSLGPVRPYGTVGLGTVRTTAEFNLADTVSFEKTDFGWTIGGGVMVFPSDHVGIRGDLRHVRGTGDLDIGGFAIEGSSLDFWRALASVILRF